jgi:hypothetical protein
MKYRDGYKYQLAEDEVFQTEIFPDSDIETKFIALTRHGVLTVRAGYAWDGPSGPTWDDKTNMRGSLLHDALFQLMREKYLDQSWFHPANQEFVDCCKQDGMNPVRAWAYFEAVDSFSSYYASPRSEKPPKTAP